jgi:hypothetical protein
MHIKNDSARFQTSERPRTSCATQPGYPCRLIASNPALVCKYVCTDGIKRIGGGFGGTCLSPILEGTPPWLGLRVSPVSF